MKWFITYNMFFRTQNSLHILPEFAIWYSKERFFETGVYTPSFEILICWIKWKWVFGMQKGY